MNNNFELAVEFDNKKDRKNYDEIKSEVLFITERSTCLTEQNLKYHLHDGKIVHCSSCSKNIFPKTYKEDIEFGIWRKEHLCQECITQFEQFETQNNEIEIFKKYGSKCVLCGKTNDDLTSSALGIAPICTKCNSKLVSPINKNKIEKYS